MREAVRAAYLSAWTGQRVDFPVSKVDYDTFLAGQREKEAEFM